MEALIRVTTNERGSRVVSARELHNFLGIGTDFNVWCKRMFEYGFEDGIDYTKIGESVNQYVTRFDFALTLDAAKEIAMIQRTERGKQARQYFIACERALMEQTSPKPMTIEELIIAQAQSMLDVKRQVATLEEKVHLIEAKTATRPDYFTIMGYAVISGVQVSLSMAAQLGRKAKRMCHEKGYPVDEVPDPRFGKVCVYPTTVLQQVFQTTQVR